MPINIKTKERAKSILKAIEIGKEILEKSKSIDPTIKSAFGFSSQYSINTILDCFNKNKLTLYQVKTIESEFFTYWNETISLDTELFWKEIQNNNLHFERKNPIKYLLENGRLRHVEQWIDLYNNINQLKEAGQLKLLLDDDEIIKLQELLDKEEQKRYSLVKRYHDKGSIALSNYSKFGEAMAFLERCNLTLKYFSAQEREQIYEMWQKRN